MQAPFMKHKVNEKITNMVREVISWQAGSVKERINKASKALALDYWRTFNYHHGKVGCVEAHEYLNVTTLYAVARTKREEAIQREIDAYNRRLAEARASRSRIVGLVVPSAIEAPNFDVMIAQRAAAEAAD